MALMSSTERAQARALAEVALANPFLPERVEAERRLLGPEFVEGGAVWHARPVALESYNPNVPRLAERAAALACRERLARGARPTDEERALYEDVVVYLLYHRVEPELYALVTGAADPAGRLPALPRLAREVQHYLGMPALGGSPPDPAHLL